jgi:hypothetical protein
VRVSDWLGSLLFKAGIRRPDCVVHGCDKTETELVELSPLDPIDHHARTLPLCEQHQAWASERNKLAAEVKAELVEARKEIGQRRIDEVQRLAVPQDGDLREDILMGEPDERFVHISDAVEGGESA